MLNINIKDQLFKIVSIDKSSIPKIYSIYSNSKDFKYATGIFQSLEYGKFAYNISQFIQRESNFFLDVHLNSGETIGLIKGLYIKRSNIVWINSMVIDTPFQRKGYGQKVIGLLQNYFKQVCYAEKIYLSVYKSNVLGINFWIKCGFVSCDKLPDKEKDKFNDIIQIMYKLL